MATNRMKALYTIMLPKRSNVPGIERTTEEVNEERLNDNFRTITNELVKLWEGGEHNLNVLSARISSAESTFVTAPDAAGIAADAVANNAAIIALPDTIRSQVSEIITGYATTEELAGALAAANEYSDSQLTQTADSLSVTINQQALILSGEDTTSPGIGKTIYDLSSWVKIVGLDLDHGTNPGVIIGRSGADASLKAEADAIFFFKGDETQAKKANQLAGFDASGNFVARAVHTDSMELNSEFDIDVVSANGVDFLHITGRS